MILIVTAYAQDPTVVRLRETLVQMGEPPVVLDAQSMEKSVGIQVATKRGGGGAFLQLGDRRVDFSDIRSAWLWRNWQRMPFEEPLKSLATRRKEWSFYKKEWKSFCSGFGLALMASNVFCVNKPPFNTAFEEKCAQLLVAAQEGFLVPSTLYTADLGVARDFSDEHPTGIIYKPFTTFVRTSGGTPTHPARVGTLYTSRVKREDLNDSDGRIPTPGVFQPYIEKQLELRVVVVGRQVFACAIHSQDSSRTKTDWRRYDLENVRHEPYALPPEVSQRILRVMDRLGLVFGSLDIIITPGGEFVFLEVNPNGQFDWVASLAGLPVYECLASMLRAGSVDYVAPPARVVSHEAARAG